MCRTIWHAGVRKDLPAWTTSSKGPKMKRLFWYVLVIAAIILALSTARPYWDRYWIGKELEVAAVYGTKHSIQDTRGFLSEKMKQSGYRFRPEDLDIEKDEKNRVTITLSYRDAVSVFGRKLKDLAFTVTKSVSEVKDVL
jgi:hypothetical protein